VKRRLQQSAIEPPAKLRFFDSSDWPGGDVDLWRQARREYVQVNGYPGDPVEWLRQQVRTLRRL
jgi:hypothetical protein